MNRTGTGNNITIHARFVVVILLITAGLGGCLRYSFTGVTIPSSVRTVYIPFFPDQSGSGLGELSNLLNDALIDRFVNQTRLSLTDSPENADVVLDGSITSYSNQPFSIGGDARANLRRVQISVRASYMYTSENSPEWEKTFSGNFEYDPVEDDVGGEDMAALEALTRIAENMFNDAMGDW